jgi:hypothetical protein
MDTPPNPPKNWNDLITRARSAQAPDIDVRHSVRNTIASLRHARPVPTALTHLSFQGSRSWLVGSLAALAMLAITSAYLGLQATSELSLALSLSSAF